VESSGLIAGQYAHEEFTKSFVWQDMRNEILAWLEDARDHLESEEDAREIAKFQGITMACRNFLNLPDSIIEAYLASTPMAQDEIEEE